MTENALRVIEQKEVEFYGDELTAVRAADGHIYVSVRHLCDALGIDRVSQTRRIKRQEMLDAGYAGGVILTPPGAGGGGGQQQAGLLRVDLVPLFLTGISIKAVRDEVQPKLKRFQQEAAKVLWEAFQEGRLTADPDFDALLETADPDAVQAYQVLQAMARLARSHILLSGQVEQQARILDDHDRRLEAIETTLSDTGRNVTPDQASQISQAVKAVALAAGKKSGRNEFGAVYGELYRKFGITSYKMLPNRRFEEAMNFLTNWYEDLTGETAF
jgi:hypothetical protein